MGREKGSDLYLFHVKVEEFRPLDASSRKFGHRSDFLPCG